MSTNDTTAPITVGDTATAQTHDGREITGMVVGITYPLAVIEVVTEGETFSCFHTVHVDNLRRPRTPGFTTGQTLTWVNAPTCGCASHDGRQVSFRRDIGDGYAEVFTCRGSQNVPMADLRATDAEPIHLHLRGDTLGTGITVRGDGQGIHLTAYDHNRGENGVEAEMLLSFGSAEVLYHALGNLLHGPDMEDDNAFRDYDGSAAGFYRRGGGTTRGDGGF